MALNSLKFILPNHPMPMRILRGPFRGGRMLLNPRKSLRKACGLYEHELNAWLRMALPRVSRVLDVGANDGYFSFGCMAAFRRLGIAGQIYAFEPQISCADALRESASAQQASNVVLRIIQTFVGSEVTEQVTTLDSLENCDRRRTLIKIDVEGSELDVITGARSWMHPSNLFVIEVHKEEFLSQIVHFFADRGLKLAQIDQKALPFIGRENRDSKNWWLASEIGAPD